MSEKLKPCPFCGINDIDPEGYMVGDGAYRAFGPTCRKCGASSGLEGTTEENQVAWNRRTDSADAKDAARYRFICKSDDPLWRPLGLREGGPQSVMNATIDAAMEQSK